MAAITSAVAVGSAVVGGVVQAKSASKAAKTQAQAARDAGNLEYSQYLQTRDDLLEKQRRIEEGVQEILPTYDPYVNVGRQADDQVQALSGALGPEAQAEAYKQYQESPGVAFAREQGMRGLEQDIAVTGQGGGTRLKELSRFNQGLAMQDFNTQYNRLASQGDLGRAYLDKQTALELGALEGNLQTAQNIGTMGAAATGSRAQSINDAAAARAGGQIARGQALGGVLQSVGSFAGAGGFGNLGGGSSNVGATQAGYSPRFMNSWSSNQ